MRRVPYRYRDNLGTPIQIGMSNLGLNTNGYCSYQAMLHRVFGVFYQSVDEGLNLVDPRFSFFLRALYLKDPSLVLVEFIQTRFKNEGLVFGIVASFLGWHSRLHPLRLRRISNFSLILFAIALFMSGSNSLRLSLHLQPTCSCLP
ncbi:hypothetical protein BHM03_00019374 [Ensete ventricosum]|nr:hypothetical protein BHM03_00019374 [Ensete ventricosum]